MILPDIDGWIVQWYLYVPVRRKYLWNDSPGASAPERHRFVFAVIVWVLLPRFTHLTRWNRKIVIVAGR
jgi:hypothetical protein